MGTCPISSYMFISKAENCLLNHSSFTTFLFLPPKVFLWRVYWFRVFWMIDTRHGWAVAYASCNMQFRKGAVLIIWVYPPSIVTGFSVSQSSWSSCGRCLRRVTRQVRVYTSTYRQARFLGEKVRKINESGDVCLVWYRSLSCRINRGAEAPGVVFALFRPLEKQYPNNYMTHDCVWYGC